MAALGKKKKINNPTKIILLSQPMVESGKAVADAVRIRTPSTSKNGVSSSASGALDLLQSWDREEENVEQGAQNGPRMVIN